MLNVKAPLGPWPFWPPAIIGKLWLASSLGDYDKGCRMTAPKQQIDDNRAKHESTGRKEAEKVIHVSIELHRSLGEERASR